MSRFVTLTASVLALPIKLDSPILFVTQSNPGIEHIDKKDDGPERSIRIKGLTSSVSSTHRDTPSRA
jgi:hypothetical protein